MSYLYLSKCVPLHSTIAVLEDEPVSSWCLRICELFQADVVFSILHVCSVLNTPSLFVSL